MWRDLFSWEGLEPFEASQGLKAAVPSLRWNIRTLDLFFELAAILKEYRPFTSHFCCIAIHDDTFVYLGSRPFVETRKQ